MRLFVRNESEFLTNICNLRLISSCLGDDFDAALSGGKTWVQSSELGVNAFRGLGVREGGGKERKCGGVEEVREGDESVGYGGGW